MTLSLESTVPSTVQQVERSIFLRAVLSGVEVGPATQQLVSAIRDVYFPAGTVVYRQGEPSEHLYFVVDGTVELRREGESPWTMGQRSAFGALDAALDQPHARTAVAIEDVHVMVLRVEDWLDVLEDHFELAQAMVLRNAKGLYELSLRLAPTGGFAVVDLDSAPAPICPTLSFDEGPDTVQRLLVFSRAPLFERAGIQPLIRLAQAAQVRHLQPGEELFRMGEPVTQLYLVAHGVVEIERDEPVLRASFGQGDLVAGPPALARAERAFYARAATEAVVLTLSREDLFDVMEDHFAALRSVLAYLAIERDRMQRLEAQLRQAASAGA